MNPSISENRMNSDEAVSLVDEAILAAENDRLLPANFPKNVIPLFAELGKTLREEESIEFHPPKGRSKVTYNTLVRERLLARGTREYQDMVTVSGEMRGTQLDGNRFTLRLQDGTNVSGKFQPDQETAITDALREHTSCRAEIQGLGIFGPDGLLKRIETVEQLYIRLTLGERSFDARRPANLGGSSCSRRSHPLGSMGEVTQRRLEAP